MPKGPTRSSSSGDWAHQLVSLKVYEQNNRVYDTSDPGTGKTRVAIKQFAKRRAKGGKCALVLCPKTLIGPAWIDEITKVAPHLTAVACVAENGRKGFDLKADIYVTNVDAAVWLAKQDKKFFARFDTLIGDEWDCFPAGTLVDTPNGPTPIEMLVRGTPVYTSAGIRPVSKTMSKQAPLVELELEDGTTFRCTPDHPIATSEGWCSAGQTRDMQAVRLVLHRLAHEGTTVLQPPMFQDRWVGKHPALGAPFDRQSFVQSQHGSAGLAQRDSVHTRRTSSDECSQKGDTNQEPRGQRQGSTMRKNGSADAPQHMGVQSGDPYEAFARQWVPDLLQSGLREPETHESDRDRRGVACWAQALGCEERFLSHLSRVVRVSDLEQEGEVDVFNIQVDGPHDYSVAGTLVHNCYKHRTSARSKAMAKIVKYFDYRAGLTGTPNPISVTELWHQVYLLDDGQRLGNNFWRFRNEVSYPEQNGPRPEHVKWIDKPEAASAVATVLKDITIRHEFEKCLDIPPNRLRYIAYEPSAKLMKAYEELVENQLLILEKGDVTAVHAAALQEKALQCLSGAIYTSTDVWEVVDRGRYELIAQLVKERRHSVVFYLWKHQRQELVKEFESEKITHDVIDGETPTNRRNAIVKAYQAGELQTVLLHPKTGAHGLTLTRGTATIWSSPTGHAGVFKQGNHRIYRGGQTKRTETICIHVPKSRERIVYERREGRTDAMQELLSMLKS